MNTFITSIVSGSISSAPVNVDGTACDDGNAATEGETSSVGHEVG